jgi:Gpi18-like mannosyltransferase
MSGRRLELALFAALFAVALLVRMAGLPYQSMDYTNFLVPWYQYIDTHAGFWALRNGSFSNYNVPYLYVIAAVSYLPVSLLKALKFTSIAFDFALALFTYLIVRMRHPARWVAGLAAIVVLLLPTVVMNSSVWAQADSIYAAFGVGGVYFLMRRQPWIACALMGTALAFKLQAVFLFPLLLALAVVRRLPWRCLIAIPVAYLAWAVPALLIGRSWHDVLFIYAGQAESSESLTLHAPSIYTFFGPVSEVDTVFKLGTLLTVGLILIVTLLVWKSRVTVDAERVLLLATLFAVLVPFFLPGMHERYFYLADVLSVALAFWTPRLILVPVLVQTASALSYLPFLFYSEATGPGRSVDERYLTVLMLGALVLLVRRFAELLRSRPSTAGVPSRSAAPDSSPRISA